MTSIRLGLSLPILLGSLIALLAGIFPGILGVWLFQAWGIAVPEFIKVGHAHAAWWSVLILMAAFFLPAVPLKPGVKKFVAFTSITAVPFWMITLVAYRGKGRYGRPVNVRRKFGTITILHS